MPLTPGPGGDEVPTPDPIVYGRAKVVDSNGVTVISEHPVIKELQDQLDLQDGASGNLQYRWDTLRRMRVVRAAVHGAYAELGLNDFPKSLYPYLADPRFSRVAGAIAVTRIQGRPEHMDMDWFGPPGANWWPGDHDGREWFRKVGGRFTHLLEDSFSLPRSEPDPTSWDWPGESSGSPWDDLRTFVSAPANALAIEIRWSTASADDALPLRAVLKSRVLTLSTGRPVKLIKLSAVG